MLARVLAVVVCLSVRLCLSVCLSHAGIVSKPLNVGSRKQRHVMTQGLQFSDVKSRWWTTPPLHYEILRLMCVSNMHREFQSRITQYSYLFFRFSWL